MAADEEVEALRRRFAADMQRGVTELACLGYDATIFHRMLSEHGAVEAARRLVLAGAPSYGLWRLKSMGRLDMSVEMWVLLPWYEPLFDMDVRQKAEDKLKLLNVPLPDELDRLVRSLETDPR